MKVHFDYQIFAAQRYGGISRYFVRLAQQLLRLGVDADVIAPIHKNKYLKELPANRVHGLSLPYWPAKTARLFGLVNRYTRPYKYTRFGVNIIHETYYSEQPTLNPRHTGRVLTVYDMIHEKFAKQFPLNDRTTGLKKIAIQRARHIICISHSTRADLCELFDVPREKTTVIHLGVDSPEPCAASVRQVEQPYLLYVGDRWGYKNFENFIRAFASNHRLSNDVQIIAFGGPPFNKNEVDLIRSVGLDADSVRQISGADSVLSLLYRQAVAFVYPSLYEGFGLPPLEAMAQGCPVAASNTSSLPEVIGDAGEYFAPTDIDAMANALERVVYDSLRRRELVDNGNRRVKQFSWQKCAEETLEVYSGVSEVESL